MTTKYIYKNKEYLSADSVRKAIWEEECKIFGTPESDEDWQALGVQVVIVEDELENPPVEPSLDELKQMKLGALDGAFAEYRQSSKTFLISSLGFKANANVTAFDNVSGLVAQLQFKADKGEENPQVGFMTFDDELVMLDIEKMKTLQVEISENGSNIYAQKWMLRQTIQAAENEETLNAIEIVFKHTDFTTEA